MRVAASARLAAHAASLLLATTLTTSLAPLPALAAPGLPSAPALARRLWPGTYGNYCGPTPEVDPSLGCVAHGWRGDAPVDTVDASCMQHDVSYCRCDQGLRQRSGERPLLSVLTALRSQLGARVIDSTLDSTYLACVNRADTELIADGVRVRGRAQRDGCTGSDQPGWFCDLEPSSILRRARRPRGTV